MGQGNKLLHILRNPWGFGDHEVKAARLEAAEKIESLGRELEAALKDRVALAAALEAERDKVRVLQDVISDAWANYQRFGEVCLFEGQPMIYASVLEEIHQAYLTATQGQKP